MATINTNRAVKKWLEENKSDLPLQEAFDRWYRMKHTPYANILNKIFDKLPVTQADINEAESGN